MPPEFRKDEHNLRRLRIAEFAGLLFGSFREDTPDLETYLGPKISAGISRVLNRPARILGRSTQVLPNNWKLYAENVKDTYHASILHLFLTTFRINRLSQEGGIVMDDSGAHHFSYSITEKRPCARTAGSASRTVPSSNRSMNMATASRCRS